MLKIVKNMASLSFSQLAAVYEQSNRRTAREQWPGLPEMEGLYRAEMEFYQYLRLDFFTQGDSFYALWQEGGETVAAVRFERWRSGWLLEGLETRPDARGRGYATALLQAALEGLEGNVYSHVERRNEASLAVHRKLGFRVGEHTAMVDGSYLPGFVTMIRE